MSQDRQPVTWNKGMESKTVFCESCGEGNNGGFKPALKAARAGATCNGLAGV